MSARDVLTAPGSTLTFEESGFAFELLSVALSGITRGDVETTDLSTKGFKTHQPEKRVDGGTVPFTVRLVPGMDPPIDRDAEQITIQFAGVGNIQFCGYLNSWDIGEATEEGPLTVSGVIKVTGPVTGL